MLTGDELIELEIRIADEIGRLERESAAAGDDLAAVAPDKAIGRLSRLDSMQIQEMAKEAQRRRTERLAELRSAQARLDEGLYGSCERCGAVIPFARLASLPEARTCASCPPQTPRD